VTGQGDSGGRETISLSGVACARPGRKLLRGRAIDGAFSDVAGACGYLQRHSPVPVLVDQLAWHRRSYRSQSLDGMTTFINRLVQSWRRTSLARFHPMLRRYLLALALLALAFGIRYALGPLFGPRSSYLFFIPATLLAAWWGGLGPAFVVGVGGFLLGDLFFAGPPFELGPYGASELVDILVYAVSALIGMAFVESFAETGAGKRGAAKGKTGGRPKGTGRLCRPA